jgi:hypothetical protein
MKLLTIICTIIFIVCPALLWILTGTHLHWAFDAGQLSVLILITASAWLAAGILIMGWTLDKEIDREIRNN